MAHYKRITKRTKTSRDDILTDPAPFFIEWAQKNQTMILMAVSTILAVAFISYGALYYVKVSRLDAQATLYGAVASASGGVGAESDLIAYIESAGGSELGVQARLELGGIYIKTEKYQQAAEQYGKAALEAVPGSVLGEVAQMGEASALLMAGNVSEAADKLRKLADSGQFSPKQHTHIELAYALASSGRDGDAVKELETAKTIDSMAMPAVGLEGVMKRIGDGEVNKALAELDAAPSVTEDGKVTTNKVHN